MAEREMGRGHNIIDMGTGNNGGGRPDAVKVIQYCSLRRSVPLGTECSYLWVRNVRTVPRDCHWGADEVTSDNKRHKNGVLLMLSFGRWAHLGSIRWR